MVQCCLSSTTALVHLDCSCRDDEEHNISWISLLVLSRCGRIRKAHHLPSRLCSARWRCNKRNCHASPVFTARALHRVLPRFPRLHGEGSASGSAPLPPSSRRGLCTASPVFAAGEGGEGEEGSTRPLRNRPRSLRKAPRPRRSGTPAPSGPSYFFQKLYQFLELGCYRRNPSAFSPDNRCQILTIVFSLPPRCGGPSPGA